MTWEQILTSYGIPTVILLGIGVFIWKKGWPFAVSQIDRLWKYIDEANNRVQSQQEEFNKVLKEQSDNFIERLKERDKHEAEIAQEIKIITAHQSEIHSHIKQINEKLDNPKK